MHIMICDVNAMQCNSMQIQHGRNKMRQHLLSKEMWGESIYESFSDLGEIRVWLRADFQSGSRVLKKVF